MKTDLTKILSISGQHGLFRYLTQARNGAIVESIADKKRSVFDLKSKISTLADISIYTNEGEVKLQDVFGKLKEVLNDAPAPEKSSAEELKALFAKAVPNYDPDRFYTSHMKKIVEWYNQLREYASLDFETPEEAQKEPQEEESKEGADKANE